MTMGSLELRSSGSYGSLRQQLFHNGVSALQVIPPRKPPKMLKDKDSLFHWICKFAPRKKFGKLLLYAASAAVFMWVLYVGKACPVCYLLLEQALAMMPNAPSFSPIIKNLAYIHKENLTKSEFGGSEFGGYPSLRQRNDSYDIKESMSMHCGFIKGVRPGYHTGFDNNDSDLLEMETCQGVVVASTIFGAFDLIRKLKNISEYVKRNVCFYMFVDEESEDFLRNSSGLDSSNRVGLWRTVVVHNLPYNDPRRNVKVMDYAYDGIKEHDATNRFFISRQNLPRHERKWYACSVEAWGAVGESRKLKCIRPFHNLTPHVDEI